MLHWHITDSQSFPIQLENHPETTGKMGKIGSYNQKSRYSVSDVKEIVEHANLRGMVYLKHTKHFSRYFVNI